MWAGWGGGKVEALGAAVKKQMLSRKGEGVESDSSVYLAVLPVAASELSLFEGRSLALAVLESL